MTDRIRLIVNPLATRVRDRLRRQVRDELEGHGEVGEAETGPDARAGDLARRALREGATLIVALGGDGTVNEIAGALAGTTAVLLPVAGGGTNVFARAMGWPHPASNAIPTIGRALAARSIRSVRLGEITADGLQRRFCVNAGLGVDANTVQRVEAHPHLKQTLRQMSFGLVSVAEAVRAAHRAPCIVMSSDDAPEIELSALIVATGSPYAFLGARPLDVTPGAAFDGRLRWLGIEQVSARNLTAVVRGALGSGSHLGRAGIHDGWAARKIRVRVDHPIALQADGEPLGRFQAVRFTPGPTVNVLVPPAGARADA